MSKVPLTPFRQHIATWKGGCGASICEGARKCFSRGTIPADVLFIGEAPGKSENVLGQPFVGPAGQLLDHIVKQGLAGGLCPPCGCLMRYDVKFSSEGVGGNYVCPKCKGSSYRPIKHVFTNLVLCIPVDEHGVKAVEPDDDDIEHCAPRLQEFVKIVSPRLIVCVGALARDWLDPRWKYHTEVLDKDGFRIPRIDITHPAAILRANIAQKGLLIQKCVVNLRNGVEDHFSYDERSL